MLGNIPPQK